MAAKGKPGQRNDPLKGVVQKIAQAEAKAGIDLDAAPTPTPSDGELGTPAELARAWGRVDQLMREYDRRLRDVEGRESRAQTQLEQLERKAQETAEEVRELEARTTEIDERERVVAERSAQQADEARRLAQLRIEAESGFAEANREAIASLEEARSRVQTDLRAATEKYLADQAEFYETARETLEQHRERLESDRTQREAELAELEDDLRRRERDIERRERTVGLRESELVGDRELIDQLAAERSVEREASLEARVESQGHQVRALTEQLTTAIREKESMRRTMIEVEGRSGEEVQAELASLRRKCANLEEELAARPDSASVERMEELDRERAELNQVVFSLRAQCSELERRLVLTSMAANEVELARDRASLLESINDGYRSEIQEAQRLWGELTDSRSNASPFPALLALSTDEGLQQPDVRTRSIDSLGEFVESVRHRMVHALQGRELYYEASDIRLFLGGLAASRLHLLQGISGTGKTSLPLAFAAAIDGGADVIEVQAGWRDRQDLIGYFNSFEQKFDERPFTQAVFKAGAPAFVDRPYFIVLDEMNLSYPEQYFADLLSLLERDTDMLRLVNAPVRAELPNFDGSFLRVPRNVWFIGTANRDETTVAFADKTYDRAHVMELPTSPKPFRVERRADSAPVSLKSMQALFDAASDAHLSEAAKAIEFLDTAMAPTLSKLFDVGWSHRLRKLTRRFVPVVVAAGGSVGEATDHLLATKVLRKVQDRFDVAPEDYQALEKHLYEAWESAFGDGDLPEKSVRIIEREAHLRA